MQIDKFTAELASKFIPGKEPLKNTEFMRREKIIEPIIANRRLVTEAGS